MNAAFEIKGYWWLPSTPQVRVPGSMFYSPGEPIRLSLMGALNQTTEQNIPPPDMINPDLIHGCTSEGSAITLYRCLQTKQKSSMGLAEIYFSSEYIAHWAFKGVYFNAVDEVGFNKLFFRLYNLDRWFDVNCIDEKHAQDGVYAIMFQRPHPIIVDLKDLSIEIGVFEKSSYQNNRIEISPQVSITISLKNGSSLEDYVGYLRLVQNFFTFSMSGPTFVTEAKGVVQGEGSENSDHSSQILVNIFYPASGWQPRVTETNSWNMLLPYSVVDGILPGLLSNWIQNAETIRSVYDLFFMSDYNPSMYLESDFLSLAQAVETYHRQVYGGKYQGDEDFFKGTYLALVNAIPRDLDSNFRNSLKNGKLKYANEYSLRTRLKMLTKHIASHIPVNFVCDNNSRNRFSERVADSRNYYTHYSPELQPLAARGNELFNLNCKLRLILQICFLEQLGFSSDKIIQIIKRYKGNRQYLPQS